MFLDLSSNYPAEYVSDWLVSHGFGLAQIEWNKQHKEENDDINISELFVKTQIKNRGVKKAFEKMVYEMFTLLFDAERMLAGLYRSYMDDGDIMESDVFLVESMRLGLLAVYRRIEEEYYKKIEESVKEDQR